MRKPATRRQKPANDCESPRTVFSGGKYGSMPGMASVDDDGAPQFPQNL